MVCLLSMLVWRLGWSLLLLDFLISYIQGALYPFTRVLYYVDIVFPSELSDVIALYLVKP